MNLTVWLGQLIAPQVPINIPVGCYTSCQNVLLCSSETKIRGEDNGRNLRINNISTLGFVELCSVMCQLLES